MTGLDAALLEICRDLLKRHPLRRGPFIITDADLRKTLRRLTTTTPGSAER